VDPGIGVGLGLCRRRRLRLRLLKVAKGVEKYIWDERQGAFFAFGASWLRSGEIVAECFSSGLRVQTAGYWTASVRGAVASMAYRAKYRLCQIGSLKLGLSGPCDIAVE
jgi:hypothetical protein